MNTNDMNNQVPNNEPQTNTQPVNNKPKIEELIIEPLPAKTASPVPQPMPATPEAPTPEPMTEVPAQPEVVQQVPQAPAVEPEIDRPREEIPALKIKAEAPKVEEEDNRIIRPVGYVERKPEEEQPKKKEPRRPVVTSADMSENLVKYTSKKKDANILENQHMKEVQINYKPPGKFKMFLLFVLFICLFVVVFFMPEINEFISNARNNASSKDNTTEKQETSTEEKDVSGTLTCSLESNDKTYDYINTYDFKYTNDKLEELNYTSTVKGDKTLDRVALTDVYTKCTNLQTELADTEGIVITCDYFEGTETTTQNFKYNTLNKENLTTIYKKYGFTIPDYDYNDDITSIQKTLKTSGYLCVDEKE